MGDLARLVPEGPGSSQRWQLLQQLQTDHDKGLTVATTALHTMPEDRIVLIGQDLLTVLHINASM